MTVPLLGFDNPQFHTGRNTSVRRGARWHGVAQACIELGEVTDASRNEIAGAPAAEAEASSEESAAD